MKLSQMKGDAAFDAMVRMVPYVAAILEDDKVQQARDSLRGKKNLRAGEVMQAVMPLMLQNHRDDLMGIASVMSDHTVEELKEMDFAALAPLLRDTFCEELFDFFPSCMALVLRA